MRICKSCNCYVNDNEQNCPVCGSHTEPTEYTEKMTSGTYPTKNITKTPKTLIHDIFVGVFAIIITAFALVSILTKNWAFLLIAGTSVAYIWLTVFRNIFLKREISTILTSVFGYTILIFNAIMLHYYCTGYTYVLNTAIGIVSPILLSVMNLVFMLTTLITRKWYKFVFHDAIIGLAEIVWLVACIIAKLNYVASIVSASMGLLTIVFLLIIKKDVLLSEFKKRLHF